APGENVHVARREAVPPGHQPTPAELARIAPDGQGTSFAVALTAGVAALWLEHFGFDSCRDEARRRGNLPVQELFRAALRASAQVPPGWDHRNMGAGIVDAMALLSLPLDRIPLGAAGPLPETGPALALLADAADVARYSAELEFLSFDRALRGDPERAAELETPLAPAPSPGLARRIVLPPAALMPAPAAIIGPLTPPVPLETALRRLGAAGTPGLESTGAVSLEGALERIRAEGPASILASAESVLASRRALPGSPADAALQDEALRRMEQALAAVVSGDPARLAAEGDHRFALEALVRLTGRPALRLTEDDADLATNPNIGIWAGHLLPNRDRWRPGADAVGRIDVMDHRGEWVHGGTGILLAGNRVLTNRHVLDVFAEPLPGGAAFQLARRASIIFDPEALDEARRFEITGVVTAGRERIGRHVDLGKLDVAVVALEPGANAARLPAPAAPAAASTAAGGGIENVVVIGYPARPGYAQAPQDGETALKFWDRVGELYGDRFGVKYLSPGALMDRPGALAGDPQGWAFSHDATTFAGNSGSAVLALDGAFGLCGLHFGGSTLTMNLAHDLATVRARGADFIDVTAL
ncbi:trypsin-like peptidase domain-containing protein, partial [Albidovulum sp.]